MSDTPRELVVVVTHGIDHEVSSVAFTIATGGITCGLKVSVFLTSAGVDLVRKRAADTTRVAPLETVERGYSNVVQRLISLGAQVAKIE